MSDGSKGSRKTLVDSLLVFCAAFAMYLVLRSRSYNGDGLRYLPAMLSPTVPRDGGSGHLLSPYVGWLAFRLCDILGIQKSGGDGLVNTRAIELIQGVNAFAAGIGLAVLYLWLRDVASRRAALVGVALMGFSHAFLVHATDMTEPIAAVPPMMFGLWLLNRAPDRTWSRTLIGGFIGLGAAFYLIALLAVAPAVWIAARPHSPSTRFPQLPRLLRVGVEIAGASIATLAGLIATTRFATNAILGANSVSGPSGRALFGSFDPRHFAAGIFGFV